ncbi:MAG: DUF2326 domain-containing protein [Colwellia sp.]|nr:DUF2326 domain-containing protein [Colwellia sp.]
MKLNRFILEINGEIVRNIPFFDDLNIITSKKNTNKPGNSIGKSTLGRVIDYLLDGSLGPIYIDEEFNKPNNEIETLFAKQTVYASLEYIGINNTKSIIKRRLSTEVSDQNYCINNEVVSKKVYVSHVMRTIFNVDSVKPTLRKLAPKFFRTNQHRMLHTVKFDNSRNVSPADISTVFLYLFDFNDTEILSTRHKLKSAIARYKKQSKSFTGVISEQKIVGTVNKTKKEIEKLEKSLLSTDKDVDKLGLVNEINELDDEQNTLSDKILTLDLRIKNIIKTNEILKSEDQCHLVNELRVIYEYASIKIESVLNDFDSSLDFHNQLLNTKKEFVTDGLDKLKALHIDCKEKVDLLKRKKEQLYKELKSKKKIEELSETVKKIGELNKELIKLSAILEQKDIIETKLNIEEGKLLQLSSQLDEELKKVDSFEKSFINNFKIYTKEFYEVEYNFSLNLDKTKGECSPTVDDVQSNNEGGLKRLEAITFDLSYIKTVCDNKTNRPNFILHDSIDDIDIEHIKKMFELSKALPGQHIVSMLSDKLTDEQYEKYEKYIILELSQDDKFFKV